jgi:hypothetical protein
MGTGCGVGEGTSVGVAVGTKVGVAVGSGEGVGEGVAVGGRETAVSTLVCAGSGRVSLVTGVGWVKKLTGVAVGGGGGGVEALQAVRLTINSKFGKAINRKVLISSSIVFNMFLMNPPFGKTLPIISTLLEASKKLICVIMAAQSYLEL